MWIKFKDRFPPDYCEVRIFDTRHKVIRSLYVSYSEDFDSAYCRGLSDHVLWWDDIPPLPDESNTFDPNSIDNHTAKGGEVWENIKERVIIINIYSQKIRIKNPLEFVEFSTYFLCLEYFLENYKKCEDQSYWYEDDSFKVGRVYLENYEAPRRVLFINENVIFTENPEVKRFYNIYMKNADGIYTSINPRYHLTLKLSTNQELGNECKND